jgi:hypothetical protein
MERLSIICLRAGKSEKKSEAFRRAEYDIPDTGMPT